MATPGQHGRCKCERSRFNDSDDGGFGFARRREEEGEKREGLGCARLGIVQGDLWGGGGRGGGGWADLGVGQVVSLIAVERKAQLALVSACGEGR